MRRFRFAYLLGALALVSFVRPFIEGLALGSATVDILVFMSMLAGAYSVINRDRRFTIIVILGVVSAIAQIGFYFTDYPGLVIAFLITALLFYGLVTWVLLRTLFDDHMRITRDTLYQAVSVYLLLGLVGAMAYALLEVVNPGSFHFGDNTIASDARLDRFLGFSFTTLTTLGYGNISPATPKADALATFQAVAGQIYIAVVIARLVAIEIGQRSRSDSKHH